MKEVFPVLLHTYCCQLLHLASKNRLYYTIIQETIPSHHCGSSPRATGR